MSESDLVLRGIECCAKNSRDCANCPYVKSQFHMQCQHILMGDLLIYVEEQQVKLKEWARFVPYLIAHGVLHGEE